jgi:hypothetical protein
VDQMAHPSVAVVAGQLVAQPLVGQPSVARRLAGQPLVESVSVVSALAGSVTVV